MVFVEVKRLGKYVRQYIAEKEDAFFNLDLGYYYYWAGVRIFLALLPQTGYIQFSKDEYSQSNGVLPGSKFDTESNVPFEFNATHPMRSTPVFFLTIYIPMFILRIISFVMESIVGLNLAADYLMLVLPQLSMVMLSFISDICLFKICYAVGQNFKHRLVVFASSFISLVSMTRTFTNAIEMICFNILVCLISLVIADFEKNILGTSSQADELKEKTKVPDDVGIKKLLKMIQQHTLGNCVPIAIVTVTGFFNRPTFLLFAFTPLFYWFELNLTTQSDRLKEVYKRIFVFVLYCIPVIFFFVYFDSLYYGYITWRDVLKLDIGFKNLVVTPYNYLTCDLGFGDVKKYGVHSKPHHLIVNILLTINTFALLVTNLIFRFVYKSCYPNWSLLPKSRSITRMLTLSAIIPVMGLTNIPRQKPWFISPILLPLVILYSHLIRDLENEFQVVESYPKPFPNVLNRRFEYPPGKKFPPGDIGGIKRPIDIRVWYLFNVVCILFYGFVHQDAIYE